MRPRPCGSRRFSRLRRIDIQPMAACNWRCAARPVLMYRGQGVSLARSRRHDEAVPAVLGVPALTKRSPALCTVGSD
jgi:hypothetical protein